MEPKNNHNNNVQERDLNRVGGGGCGGGDGEERKEIQDGEQEE